MFTFVSLSFVFSLTFISWEQNHSNGGGRAGQHRRGPAHGYGEGRSHYYPPKGMFEN